MTCDVHWCVTVDYQQIANDNIANQIHGFTIDYGKFILNAVYTVLPYKFGFCSIGDTTTENDSDLSVDTLSKWV